MRGAVVGGLARQAADCVWDYPGIDVTHYNAEDVRRVCASAERGGTDVVVLVTKFSSHAVENKIRDTGVKLIRWDQGLKELSRKLPEVINPTVRVNSNEHVNGSNGAVNVPAKPEAGRSWVDRISEVLQIDTSKAWTTKEIAEELGADASKQPRISEALVKLRAQGRAHASYRGREKTHQWVPDAHVEAAKAEYLREREAELEETRRLMTPVSEGPTAPAEALGPWRHPDTSCRQRPSLRSLPSPPRPLPLRLQRRRTTRPTWGPSSPKRAW